MGCVIHSTGKKILQVLRFQEEAEVNAVGEGRQVVDENPEDQLGPGEEDGQR